MNIFESVLKKRTPNGFMLLEVLLSIGLLALILSTLGEVVIISGGTTRGGQSNKATWAAQEGLAALQSMKFSDLTTTTTGTLSFSGNQWHLSSGSPQTIGTGITRVVKVVSVNRDASCNIVASGGTTDVDTKTLQSLVTWIDLAGRSHTVTLSSLKTQWDNPQGSCFKPTEAGCSNIDYLTSGQWYGGKQLRTVYFANTCNSTPIVIDKIILTWDNGAEIQQMFIGSTKVWSSAGPGTPRGEQNSGATLDISDFTLQPGVQYELNKTQFEHAMAGTTVTITLIFSDGTSFSTPPFVPTS